MRDAPGVGDHTGLPQRRRIDEGLSQINSIRIYWWLIAFPGGVLVATLLALNFLGDGLRDAWDVKGRN